MTQENYGDRISNHGHTEIGSEKKRNKVSPVIINLPQDDSGEWMKDELKRIAQESNMGMSALCRKVLIEPVNGNKKQDAGERNQPTHVDGF